MQPEVNTISNEELIRKVQQQSRYFVYEVQDILRALAIVVAEEISKGNPVKLKGLGTFSYKPPRLVQNYSPWTGEHMKVLSKKTCKFKPDTLFLNLLNEDHKVK